MCAAVAKQSVAARCADEAVDAADSPALALDNGCSNWRSRQPLTMPPDMAANIATCTGHSMNVAAAVSVSNDGPGKGGAEASV
jgi:hypothetical protein